MKMKELSALTGINDRTIRYYIDDGVFVPEKQSENYAGRKSYDYTENDVKLIKQIALLRKYNFSIKDIKSFFKGEADIVSALKNHIEESKESALLQNENIAVMEKVLNNSPKDVDTLCEMLSNPTVEQAPLPVIDEQSAYKPMYKKTKSTIKSYKIAITVSLCIIFIPQLILLILLGCDYFYNTLVRSKKTVLIYDAAYYEKIWTLPELLFSDNEQFSLIFPKSIDSKNSPDLFCNYFGKEIQVLLNVKYSADDYEREVERLSKTEKYYVCYDETHFSLPAYISVYGASECFEYALVDDEKLTVHYVYLQNVSEEYLAIDNRFVISDYDYVYSELCANKEAFNVYEGKTEFYDGEEAYE
mgnify:CR=1 FL=1